MSIYNTFIIKNDKLVLNLKTTEVVLIKQLIKKHHKHIIMRNKKIVRNTYAK